MPLTIMLVARISKESEHPLTMDAFLLCLVSYLFSRILNPIQLHFTTFHVLLF